MGKLPVNRLFYIDPMSYNNLSLYDKLFLDNISIKEKFFFGNVKFEYKDKTTDVIQKFIYTYSDKIFFIKFLSYFLSQSRLLFYIFIWRPDVIHFQWFKLPFVDLFFLRLIRLINKKTRIIFTAHNILPHDSGNKFKSIYKKIYNVVDFIIVHDASSKQELIEKFNIQLSFVKVVVHGLLDLNLFDEDVKIKKTESIVFSMVGHIAAYKGIDLLISAWSNSDLLRTKSNIKLIIAGEFSPDIRSHAIKLNGLDNVEIRDYFLDREEFINIIKLSDVLILPYIRISQSGLLLTALASRKCVLVTNIGGLTQPFEIGKVGWIINEATSDALQRKLEYISNNIEEIYEINSDYELWEKIHDFYSWSKIGMETLAVYNS